MTQAAPTGTCRICGGAARVALSKDRNVSCGDYFEGRRLYPVSAGAIDLLECEACGFAWFAEMHGWSEARFRTDIYNAEYELCDPPFREERPARLAAWLAPLAAGRRLLDYGGGEGRLAELLRATGAEAASCDPFHGETALPAGQADIVTAFEVVEHVPDQAGLFETLKALARADGVIIFSTLLKPPRLQGDWWYASPRNGHISFHTTDSLSSTLDAAGLTGVSLSNELHLAAADPSRLVALRDLAAIPVSGAPTFALPLS